MDKLFNAVSIITGLLGGIFASLFGAWDTLLCVLVVLMAVDYITGIIKAVYTKTLSSDIGYKGLLKKILILALVVLANEIQVLTGDSCAIREIVIMFYIANEGISILENAAAVLPNMPSGLKDILLQLRGDGDENN